MQKKRFLNYELLRIICMMMVTTLHFWGHSGYLTKNVSKLFFVGWGFETISLVATDVFIIISSYFIYNNSFKLDRIISIHSKIVIVSLLGVFATIIAGEYHLNIKTVTFLFPVLTREWGFVNNYLFFYCTAPLLNDFIRNAPRESYKKVLLVALTVFCVLPIVAYAVGVDYIPLSHGDSFVWFLVIYLIIGYIRKYEIHFSVRKSLLMWMLPVLFQYLSKVLIAIYTNYSFGQVMYSGLFYQGDSTIFTFISALGVFMLFTNMKYEANGSLVEKCLMILSGEAFYVYLIQEHPLLRDLLWESVFVNDRGDAFVMIKWFVSIIIIYFVAVIIGLIIDRVVLLSKVNSVLLNLFTSKK